MQAGRLAFGDISFNSVTQTNELTSDVWLYRVFVVTSGQKLRQEMGITAAGTDLAPGLQSENQHTR